MAKQKDVSALPRGFYSWAFFIHFLVSFLIAVPASLKFSSRGVLDFLFLNSALFSQLTLFAIVATVLLRLFLFFPGVGRSPVGVTALVYGLSQILLYLNFKIFSILGIHINGLVVSTVFTPGGLQSLNVSSAEKFQFIGACIAFLALEYIVFLKLAKGLRERSSVNPLGRRVHVAFWVLFLFLTVSEKLAYAFGDAFEWGWALQNSRAVPLYQPLTMRTHIAKVFDLTIDKKTDHVRANSRHSLNYPSQPLRFQNQSNSFPNIVFIVLDCWRSDMLNPEVSPNIWKFTQKSQNFTNHISGGNATRFGLFSLYYGLYGSYWHSFLEARKPPVLIETLRKHNYSMLNMASASLSSPEFRQTVFSSVLESTKDDFPSTSQAGRDSQMVDAAISFLNNQSNERPFFVSMFLDGTHAPFTFDEQFAKFQPYTQFFKYLDLDDRDKVTGMFNRYRNSIVAADHTVGRFLDHLAQSGRLENTWVFVTGDHGEEFYEKGYWGHNGAFTREQVQVPMVVYIPGKEPSVQGKLTGHVDVAATLMEEVFGVQNAPTDYSLGQSLFEKSGANYQVSCSWDECALLDDSGWFVFGTSSHKALQWELRDKNYVPIRNPADGTSLNSKYYSSLLENISRF